MRQRVLVSWSPQKWLVTLERVSHQASFSSQGSTSLSIQAKTTSPEQRGLFGKRGTGIRMPNDLLSNRSQVQAVIGPPLHGLLSNAVTVPPAILEK